MASLHVWKGNEAIVCTFHRTPSDWAYEPLSAIETQEFIRILQAEASPGCRPVSPARWAMVADGPEGL